MSRFHVFRQLKSDSSKCAYCNAPAAQHTDMSPGDLIEALKAAAAAALSAERWILTATLCRAIEEISLDHLVDQGAAGALEALRGSTVAVPLLGATRDEQPSQNMRRTCATCRNHGAMFTRLIDVSRTPDQPETMPGTSRWAHIDANGYETFPGDGHPFIVDPDL